MIYRGLRNAIINIRVQYYNKEDVFKTIVYHNILIYEL